jgi:hypothetical protein
MFKILKVESTPIFYPFNVKKKNFETAWICMILSMVEALPIMKPFSQNKLTCSIFCSHCVVSKI